MSVVCILKETLKKKNKTLYWLNKNTDVTYATLNNYDKNRVKRYDGEVISKICKALECDISDILRLEED